MSHLIVLRHVRVENANAIAGLTYGFPAITHFLGFTHALSRKLQPTHSLALLNCGVISHRQQLHAHTSGYDPLFSLTRNPLTKAAETAPFNEEGRMHMTVSLLIECQGVISNGREGAEALAKQLEQLCLSQHLAGGLIVSIGQVTVQTFPSEPTALRRLMHRLLPGFALLDRTELLQPHFETLKQTNPQAELLDAWLDFSALKMQAVAPDGTQQPTVDDPATWQWLPKPGNGGFLVPLQTGYQAISPLYSPGEVENARDPTEPFCFAEAIYGIGEWRSLHRIDDLSTLLWHYHHQDGSYACRTAVAAVDEEYQFNDFTE